MTTTLPPPAVHADGLRWEVARAWAPVRGRMPVELRREGAVRGGYWDGHDVDALPVGSDPALPALPGAVRAGGGGTVVSHRAGRRCVVHGADGAFRKVVRSGRAALVMDGIASAAAFAGPFRMPVVLHHDDAVVTFAALPGRSLHVAAGWGIDDWTRAWTEVLEAWVASVSRGLPAVAADVHDAVAEAGVLRGWVDRAAHFGAPVPGWKAACDRVVASLLQLSPPTGGPVPIHRDLHDKQLLWDPALGPGMLDVDTACPGDPAVDLGNLLAHAHWRNAQKLWTSAQSGVVLALTEVAARAAGCAPDRLAVFESAARLRLSCVYALRPRWRSSVSALVPCPIDQEAS